MPTNIKVGLSIVVLVVGVLMYIWEVDQGNVQLSWIVIGLSVFMVFAMWNFQKPDRPVRIRKSRIDRPRMPPPEEWSKFFP